MSDTPTHGYTESGQAVHAVTADHHPAKTRYQQFNKVVATRVTAFVGSMTCAYIFCLLALASLPAVLSGFPMFDSAFPNWMIRPSVIALVAWIAQTFLQLVLLSVIMVGQEVQSLAADARSAKTFEDTEHIIDVLDVNTAGGLQVVLEEVRSIHRAIMGEHQNEQQA